MATRTDPGTEVIYCDENLARLRELPDEYVDLIYLDPPFFSNKTYEVIWGDEAEVRSFEDRWDGGIRHYTDWMRSRLFELHRVLKASGSIYLHCDPHASHYLKVLMDDLFGVENFRNEIIWKRKAGRGETNRAAVRFGVTCDTILFYAKSDKAPFTRQYRASNPDYIASKFTHVDPDGRRYRRDNITSPSPRPNLVYEYKGHSPPPNGWAVSRERMEQMDAEDRLYLPADKSKRIQRKRYLDELAGETVDSLWDDISPINSQAAERLGWPTQKPEALLERIIRASSNKGDVVLDPFCGCGTTIAVAQQLQRHWIGIDISPQAVKIMKRRVDSVGANAKVIGLPATLEELRKLGHYEFQNWVIDAVNGVQRTRKSRDLGIDGYSFFDRHPIQVKQSEHVGRNVVDNFETAIERDGKEMGYVVAFSFTRDAYGEAARTREIGKNKVHLVRVSDLLELHDIILAALAARTKPDMSHVEPDIARLVAGVMQRRQYSRPEIAPDELFASAAAN